MIKKQFQYLLLSMIAISSCEENGGSLTVSEFGKVDGKQVQLYEIEFPGQLRAKVTNYGGIVTELQVPGKTGELEDVVLGYDQLQGYLDKTPYFGALVGRYGNRIAHGKFRLDGKEYTLATNNGLNHLHGGTKGFDKVVWNVIETKESKESIHLVLQYVSKDGEEGYPGKLLSTVTYTFTPGEFTIEYTATTDKATIVNLTQHTYFNLSGDLKEDILGHELQLDATAFLPVDSTLIPTGELRPVAGSPFDFTSPKAVGKEINAEDQQLAYGLGYDHCWVLDGGKTTSLRRVGSLYHPSSGRRMEVHTTEPGLQFYSGNFLDGSITGKGGKVYPHRYGLCLETQHYPGSPNRPGFPKVVLRPGQEYRSVTSYKFSVEQ